MSPCRREAFPETFLLKVEVSVVALPLAISALRGSNCSVGDIFHGLTVQGHRCVVAVKSERRGKFQFSKKRFDFEGIMILL